MVITNEHILEKISPAFVETIISRLHERRNIQFSKAELQFGVQI